MATSMGTRFIDLPLNQYESKWVGDAEKRLNRYLELMMEYHAITGQKVLLFFDEAEEALKDRRLEGYHGPRVNMLLRHMDGLENNQGIIFGAATNHVEKVDPAFLRAGRFDYIIKIPEYDLEGLAGVVKATQSKFNRKAPHHDPFVLKDNEYLKIAKLAKADGLTPADIAEIFRLSAETRIKRLISEKELVGNTICIITYQDLANEIKTYRKVEDKHIGFT
jgi:transitional endoplasmic reticulum ATPase